MSNEAMEIVPIVVAYHSASWIRVAVESYLEHFPEDRLLVVENNPRRGEVGWLPECAQEREWLASHPGVILIENPAPPDGLLHNRTHGAGMDLALAWCRSHGAKVLIHIEPDCLVAGRRWRDNLLCALDRGAWMAAGVRQCHGPLHPTPSAWLVNEVRASFTITPWRGPDEQHPRFAQLVDPDALKYDSSPMGVWIGWTCHWDTGHKAWFEAAVRDRAVLVETPDFTHYWHGSYGQRLSEAALLVRYPPLRPFLQRAQSRVKRIPIEQCPYRDRPDEVGGEQVARCRLLHEISNVEEEELCLVRRDACEACCATFAPSTQEVNPVVAALLFNLASRVLARGGVSHCDVEQAAALRQLAETNLDVDWP
jgi:hypothetical protein